MDIREKQDLIRQKAQESSTLASKLEEMGFDNEIVRNQTEISEKLSNFADSIDPLIKRSQKDIARQEARKIYLDTLNEYPKIKITLLFFLFLLISSLLLAVAIENCDCFLVAYEAYSSLVKSVVFLSLTPIILTLPILAYKTGIFILSSNEPTKKSKHPIIFWFHVLLWVGLSIGSIFTSLHWLLEYMNA